MNLISIKPVNFFPSRSFKPEFSNGSDIWIKSNRFRYQDEQDESKFTFYKIGKTFGFFLKRFLGIRKNYLVYYENQESTEIKGFCNIQNLYCGFFKTEEKYQYLAYLTNYKNHIQIYFSELSEMAKFKSKIAKFVIQLDFQNQFELTEQIGEGSFSKVHIVKKYQNSQQYAVKIVKKLDKNNVKSKQSIQYEKSALQKVNSDYVSKMFQFFEDQTNFFFILEYLPGRSLMNLIKENYKFDFQTKQFILKGILTGILSCHQQRIIHRDIKPQNIIINMLTFRPKLIDLGLCLILDEKTSLKNYKRCGTMGYIAPQVIANNAESRKQYDAKCDMFSFGIVAHLLLLNVNPIKGKNYEDTFMKNKNCKFQLNKIAIEAQYGIKCYDFLSRVLQISAKKRLSSQQALHHQFFTYKKKEEGKTASTQKQMDKKISQNSEFSEQNQLDFEIQKNIPNLNQYCVKKEI